MTLFVCVEPIGNKRNTILSSLALTKAALAKLTEGIAAVCSHILTEAKPSTELTKSVSSFQLRWKYDQA